jgi:glutathione S-transferase
MMAASPPVIVFFWPGSPWASKVTSYLALRAIPYAACHQPITMPRPDLARLGVAYRRIPVTAIGGDVYCDTLLILSALEKTFKDSTYRSLTATTPEHKALEYLLEKWTDQAVFPQAADCIPLDHPLVMDEGFIKDRTEMWGDDWAPNARAKKRGPGVVQMRGFFSFLENTILSDGRDWLLATDKPMLADIQTAWIFEWMLSLEGSFPDTVISEKIHPKTFAWCKRYRTAVDEATNAISKPEQISGEEAVERLEQASIRSNVQVDEHDPLGLRQGQSVEVAPIDTGMSGVQKGKLVGLSETEVVVGSKTQKGGEVLVHFPRWNFQVVSAAV